MSGRLAPPGARAAASREPAATFPSERAPPRAGHRPTFWPGLWAFPGDGCWTLSWSTPECAGTRVSHWRFANLSENQGGGAACCARRLLVRPPFELVRGVLPPWRGAKPSTPRERGVSSGKKATGQLAIPHAHATIPNLGCSQQDPCCFPGRLSDPSKREGEGGGAFNTGFPFSTC